MSDPEAQLEAAIAAAYEAFAAYPLPRTLETSPLRDPKPILRELSLAPLRDLPAESIGPYSGWALTTVGNGSDYRHFLPRIFELAVTDPAWLGFDPPVIASKLEMASWKTWPVVERAAVSDYFRAASDAIMARHPDFAFVADLWLCGCVMLDEVPAEAFRRWLASQSPNAPLQLAKFVIDQASHWRRAGVVSGPWWDDLPSALRREIGCELMSDRVRAKLEAVTGASEEDRFQLIDAALIEMRRAV
jgi:hypothetical protein